MRMSKRRLPREIRPTIIPLAKHDPISDVKVKCPVCDELMLSFLVDSSCKGHEVMNFGCSFRMCPKCSAKLLFVRANYQGNHRLRDELVSILIFLRWMQDKGKEGKLQETYSFVLGSNHIILRNGGGWIY